MPYKSEIEIKQREHERAKTNLQFSLSWLLGLIGVMLLGFFGWGFNGLGVLVGIYFIGTAFVFMGALLP